MIEGSLQNRQMWWSFNINTSDFDCDKHMFTTLFPDDSAPQKVNDILSYMTQDIAAHAKELFTNVLKTGKSEQFSCCLVTQSYAFCFVSFSVSLEQRGVLSGLMTVLLCEKTRVSVAGLFQSIINNQHHGIVISDSQTRILACNTLFEKQTGYLQQELLGCKTNIFNAGKHSPSFFKQMWSDIETKGYWNGVVLNRHAKGHASPRDLTVQKIQLENGDSYYLGLTLDVSQKREVTAQVEIDEVDVHTQLPTKSKLISLLDQICEVGNHNRLIILMALNPIFEGDSAYSDRKLFSDMLLRSATARISGYLGADIFGVCLATTCEGNSNQSALISSEIKAFIYEIKHEMSPQIFKMISRCRIGVSVFGQDANSSRTMVSHAIQAMLEMHGGQGKSVNFYQSSIHEQLQRRKALEDLVTKKIATGDIAVYFQAIVDTKTLRIAKFEALCRFTNEAGELVDTQEMITIAEELNIIPQLDKQVAFISLRSLATLQKIFGSETGITINRSLNTSLSSDVILNNTAAIIKSSGCNPKHITIELTESAYFSSQETGGKSYDAMNELRKLGVSVAIDDFGTGYSSFTYLSDRQFDLLKIDKEFVTDIAVGTRKYSIVKMVTDLSHTLGVKVVAEGVETEQEMKVLRMLGVDYLQGYLFSKPLPLENIAHANRYKAHLNVVNTTEDESDRANTLLLLVRSNVPRLDPGDSIFLANQYVQATALDSLPVINNGQCVGLVNKAALNLHLSPSMGTELENAKESVIWKRPVNQLMSTTFTQLDVMTELSTVTHLIKKKIPFPWVLVREGRYVGIITADDVLMHLSTN